MAGATRRAILAASGGLIIANASRTSAGETPIVGGGSSFVRPVMSRWAEAATKKGSPVEYKVLGTGVAQNQVLSGEIDFAAVELPFPPDKLSLGDLVQVPVVFGGMTLVVNLEGIGDGQLKLDATTLGGIFAGKIRTWSDPQVAALNPDLKLPEVEVRPVFLGEPSGSAFSTSTTLARYLIAHNADWQARFPNGLKTRWAAGSMVPTAEAMVPVVNAHPGGIGFMAMGTALANKLATVQLRNKAGETLRIQAGGLRAAVEQVNWGASADLVVETVDLPGAGVWPLVMPTYAIFPRNPADKARGQAVRAFLRGAIEQGDELVLASNGIPLPAAGRAKVNAVLAG